MQLEIVKPMTIDVASKPAGDRLGAWTDALYDYYYPLDLVTPAIDFRVGRLSILEVPGIRCGTIVSDPMHVFRRRTHLSQKSGDYYFIPMPQLDGIVLRQNGREAVVRPGGFSVIATADAYQYQQETANRLMTLRIDGPLLRRRIPMIDDLVSCSYTGETPLVRMFVDFIQSIFMQGDRFDSASAEAVAPHLVDLLALALTAPVNAANSRESSVRLGHLRRIMRAIENRLGDPNLGTRSLAAELGLSERYIQKMFSERGETLSNVIRTRRITTAQRRLQDPFRSGDSIALIAFSVGFLDPAHFSRAFKQSTGTSPSAYRRSA